MARKNIFQLLDESYDIQSEIRKINSLLCNREYFEDNSFQHFSVVRLISIFLFEDWKYRGTCITVEEYFKRAKATINSNKKTSEDVIINNLEVIENFLKLVEDNINNLRFQYGMDYYTDYKTVFIPLVKTLEKRMGLTAREYEDRVVLYPANASLEKVIELCDDVHIQWELIRYVRENLSLSEKRKSLAYLATNLGIEEDKAETNEHIKTLIKSADNILNNLHIRHNNKTGKWENQILDGFPEEDAIALCDMVYNEMLTIVLLREHKGYEPIYAAFREKQKATKTKKKTESQ